jgi:hypothetical protein
MTLDIIHHRMQLLVGEAFWFEDASVDIALATIPVRTSDKGGGVREFIRPGQETVHVP